MSRRRRLPRPQHNPHNQLPPSPRFPIDETLEILIVQRDRERHRLVRFELQLIVVARQDARGVHLLVVHLEDAGQVARRREGAPKRRRDGVLDVGPVAVALGVLVRRRALARRVRGRVEVPHVVPEAGRRRRAEHVCACADEGHADAAQRHAAVEIGEHDVWSALGGEMVGGLGRDPRRRFLLELESYGALAVDDVEVVIWGERGRFGRHRCRCRRSRIHIIQLRGDVQSTQVERRRLPKVRVIVGLTLVSTRRPRIHGNAVHACSVFGLLHVGDCSSPGSAGKTYIARESGPHCFRGTRYRRAVVLRLRVFRSAASWRWRHLALRLSRGIARQAPCCRC